MLVAIQKEKMGKVVGFLLLVTAALVGCSSPAEQSALDRAPSAAAIAKLEMADAADGSTDKVVHQCTSCKLEMTGKPEHTAAFGDYQLHFCTDFCKSSFEKDPEKALASLEGP